MRVETTSGLPHVDNKTTGRQDGCRKLFSFRPSTRTYSAVACLIAGSLIAAQALFIPAKAQVAQALMETAWEHQLSTGDPAKPWPWADFSPTARLTFPAQHRSVLALTDAAGESMAFGPAHMAASVDPGERGVAVFAAHRDTHFAFLGEVKPGDEISVETLRGVRIFRVTGSEVVRWDRSGIVTHDGGKPRIALVTCWPIGATTPGPMRYVVWAEEAGAIAPAPARLSAATPSQA